MEKENKKGIIDYIELVCLAIAGVSLVILMLLTSFDTILRYFFRAPLTGTLEISEEYLLVAIIYMPFSYVYVKGGHIKVELLERFFPDSVKAKLAKVNTLVGLILFVAIAWCSIPAVESALSTGETSWSALAYPMAPAYMMVTIGTVLASIRSVQMLLGWIHAEH